MSHGDRHGLWSQAMWDLVLASAALPALSTWISNLTFPNLNATSVKWRIKCICLQEWWTLSVLGFLSTVLILPLVCLVWQEAEAYWLFSVGLHLGWPAEDATGGWEVGKGRPILASALWLSGIPLWLLCQILRSHSTAPMSVASSHSLQPMATLSCILLLWWRRTPSWLNWTVSYSVSPHLCPPTTPKSPASLTSPSQILQWFLFYFFLPIRLFLLIRCPKY